MIADIDLTQVGALVRATAEAKILPRFRALGPGEVSEKMPGDPVTIADTEGEEMLTRLLLDAYPDTVVIGEEAVSRDPGVLSLLEGDRPVWILDPIDGTLNFAAGRSAFGTIVALVRHGETLAGWIHDPVRNLTVCAVRGSGAWCGPRRLTVETGVPSSEMVGAAYGHGWRMTEPDPELTATSLFGTVSNQLCGATEYLEIALGRRHFQLSSRSLPWDHAAGVLIVLEAGGVAEFLDGTPYDPFRHDGRVLSTANTEAAETIRRALHHSDPA